MNNIKAFMTKVKDDESLPLSLREEAFVLIKSIEKLPKKVGILQFERKIIYPGELTNGETGVTLELSDILSCHRKAYRNETALPGKIPFIKELRDHYRLGLREAKTLSEWLHNENIAKYQYPY